MAHLPHGAVGEKHLHDVEPDLDGWIAQQAQVIERGARQPAAALGVHRGSGADPFFGGTRLDFDEYQAVLIAHDQVNLAAISAEIGGEELESLASEVLFGRPLAEFAILEVQWLRRLAPPRFEARREVHGMAPKDCFDCGTAPFYNCLVHKTNEIAAGQ